MEVASFFVRFATGFTVVCLAACGGTSNGPSTPPSSTPPSVDAPVSPLPTSPSSPAASASAISKPTDTPALRRGAEVRRLWESYPWGPDDGLACPPPGASPGTSTDPRGPGIAVVMGDSLIRESRMAIAAALDEVGFDVVFLCWGGKTLLWGIEQVDTLRTLDLAPACLVINLGTNDLKGTTAQGLTDAVPMEEVAARLGTILSAVQGVPDVFVVDIAADLSLAPGTMAQVGQAPGIWQDAVAAIGIGAAIPWATRAEQGGLIGSDGVHDTSAGQYERARLIAEYVARDCST